MLLWLGARRILESQNPTNSRYKNQQIEEPLSESSRNYLKHIFNNIYNTMNKILINNTH